MSAYMVEVYLTESCTEPFINEIRVGNKDDLLYEMGKRFPECAYIYLQEI
jgi:hypothetical protein